jgi:cyclic pyranopterin phosphate synthase
LVDKYGRKINYLRLSVTDRCNLRCFYCNTCNAYEYIPHQDILTYEECFSLIQLSDALGVSKVRLTGGEPFVRKDCVRFIAHVLEKFPELDLRVTTNGTLLKDKIPYLKKVGLHYLNISLDTLERQKFLWITGRDYYSEVRQAIDDCLNHDIRVKINVVAMKGINDQEILDFVQLAAENPLDVRFIEFMPIGCESQWDTSYYWSADEMLDIIQEKKELIPLPIKEKNSGPARMYSIPHGHGKIGLISPLSHHFCATCNRFRITPDGRLRTCLFSDREYRLRPLLRSSKLGIENVFKVMKLANDRKPMGYELLRDSKNTSVCHRSMSAIGG